MKGSTPTEQRFLNASNDILNCYCGSLGASSVCTASSDPSGPNGPCASIELAALEHPPTDPPSSVTLDYFNVASGGGQANQIFSCALSSGCAMCLQ